MIRKTLKDKRRTGGFRRKVSKQYWNLLKNQEIEEQPCTIRSENQASIYQGATSVGGSVHGSDNEEVEFISAISNEHDARTDSDKSDVENDTEYEKHLAFRTKINQWAVEMNISQSALKDLAEIINELVPNILPIDPRTILATPRQISLKTIEGGEYWHNGIAKPLIKILQNWYNAPDRISLNINFDGLPIFKSSKNEFWPILCNIFENPGIRPFVVGIYFGAGKPKNLDEYLEDFINEMNRLLEEGIRIPNAERKIAIKIRCFICDSPARAYIKGVCNFNGKHGCLKCTTMGEYSHNSHTVVFPETKCPARTDDGFRRKLYGAHHKADTPILKLPINMIETFPVSDSLHLIDLGVMKRLLVGWRDGNFGKYVTKWRAREIETVTNFLKKSELPSEVHRVVRGLDSLAHWKASEFRSFLFYLSIVILPDVMKPDAFSHFLMFYCGISICSTESYRVMLPLAKELLLYFVEHYKDFYGADYVTSNVHNLLHVTDEVEMFGNLQTFNAYPFENKLYMIKRMLRTGRKPLSQVANRLAENIEEYPKKKKNPEYPFVTDKKHIKTLNLQSFKLSSKKKDSYLLTTNNEIVEVIGIKEELNVVSINGCRISNKEDVFVYPIKSSRLNIYKSINLHANSNHGNIVLDPKQIKCKLVCVKYKDVSYFIPLMHTL